jgi:TolB-like protein
VYEITPEGIRRTEPADSPDARPELANRQISRKLNTVIIAVLVLAVALLGWRLVALRHGAVNPTSPWAAAASAPTKNQASASSVVSADAKNAGAAAFNPPADTLVVLPFANLGGDPKRQYFSDGITEELTNALGQNTGLRVIAWDTASKYRDSKQSATDIGKALDVANVLTGKILRQGSEVRVIVELVNARTVAPLRRFAGQRVPGAGQDHGVDRWCAQGEVCRETRRAKRESRGARLGVAGACVDREKP